MSLPAPSPEDALELLSDDQDEILELFDRYDVLVAERASPQQRRELAEEICSLLAVHMEVKRDILYPAARDALDDEAPLDAAIECQSSLDATIADVQSDDSTEPRYNSGVRVLQELFVECIEHERTALFPRLRDSSLDLEELGGELGAHEELLLSAGDDAEPL